MAINDYLSVIKTQRDSLRENLQAKGVDTEGCDTYNQLIPKVLEIQSQRKLGAQNGVWTPTTTSEIFSLSGLDFLPMKLAICCEDVLTKSYNSAENIINVALFNIELSKDEQEMILNGNTGGIIVQVGEMTVDVFVEVENGKYGLSISFAEINKTLETPYKFKANASHVWCATEEGWLV